MLDLWGAGGVKMPTWMDSEEETDKAFLVYDRVRGLSELDENFWKGETDDPYFAMSLIHELLTGEPLGGNDKILP